MIQTSTAVHTITKVIVGITVAGAAMIAAAAGFMIAANNSYPILDIKQTVSPATHISVQGASDEPMLGLSIRAQNKGIVIKQLLFNVVADSDADFSVIDNDLSASDLIANCSLKNKRTDALIAGPVPVANGQFAFTNSIILAANSITSLIVKCELANGQATNQYAIAVQLLGDDAVTAIVAPSGDLVSRGNPGMIYVGTNGAINMDGATAVIVRDHGALHAALNASTSAADIAIADSLNVGVSYFSIAATNEPFIIKTLTLKNVGNDAAIKLVILEYYDQSGSINVVSAGLSNNLAKFSNLDIYVPAGVNSPAQIPVAVYTAGIGGTGTGSSGMKFGLNLDFSSTGSFKATGLTSGYTADETTMGRNIVASTFVLRKTRPSFALASASPSGAHAIGFNEVLQFSSTDWWSGDVTLQRLMFKLSATDAAATGWNNCGDGVSTNKLGTGTKWLLKNLTTGETISDVGDWTFLKADGSACGQTAEPVVYAEVNFGTDLTTGYPVISPMSSGSNTFSLLIDSTNASSNEDDNIRAELIDETTANLINRDAIRWVDGDTGVMNIDGTYIKNLPVIGGALVF